MKKNIILISIFLLFLSLITISSSANPNCIQEAYDYYKEYGYDLDIKGCESKYDAVDNVKYNYSITYVTIGNEVMNIYLDEIPEGFNLWNTDVIISGGKVVVSGVNGDDRNTWNIIYRAFKMFIVGVTGIGTFIMVLAFIIAAVKLGTNSADVQGRKKGTMFLLFTGVGAMGLGAVTLVFSLFWNFI